MNSHNIIDDPKIEDILAIDQEIRNSIYKKEGVL